MHIICQFGDDYALASHWVTCLKQQLPGAKVSVWQPHMPPADFAIVWNPSQEMLDQQISLKAIFNAGAGVDAIRQLRLSEDIPVIRLEDAGMAEQMSDYISHAVLHHYREMDEYAVQSEKKIWQVRSPRNKNEYSVGILGFGVLGQAVAERIHALGFRVNAWSRTPHSSRNITLYSGDSRLNDFLSASRILVCLLPLTPSTRGILCTAHFHWLPDGAYIINAGRGEHLVNDDLLQALDSGKIAGATLDVVGQEPLPSYHPFWQHHKIRITPHISAATLPAVAVRQISENITAILAGAGVSGRLDMCNGY